jgi:DNA/RNA-binding domain of Phe-tRNA-synthetase-like protein
VTDLSYAIAAEVFERFPGYVRGIVLAHGVRNGPSPAPLLALLRGAEEAARARLTVEKLAEEPRIAAWRDAFRRFGAKPSDYRPSIEALLRRVLKGQELPAISALVDIGNLVSLRHLLPTGSHAIDTLTGDIALRPATGAESFVPFGAEAVEHPSAGEIVFVEGETVLARRWIWRQANHTLTMPETTAIEFNVDGLPPASRAEVDAACRDVMALTAEFCGGGSRIEVLSRENPRISLAR